MLGAKMTKKKARWWLESIVCNHGGSLHRKALAVIFAEPVESRPKTKGEICPSCNGTGKAHGNTLPGNLHPCEDCQ